MANKKYKFKGLDEIFGESVSDLVSNIEGEKTKDFPKTKVLLDSLRVNPFQPRRIFNDSEINELADSIKIHGIIQPIIVRKLNDDFEIIAGERRSRAAKIAGLVEVPVVILDIDDKQMQEFAIIENIQRVDLLDIEEAIAYKKLSEDLGLKQEEIASRVGKSRSHIANMMRLLNLPQYVQDALMANGITMGQAKPLLAILSQEEKLKNIFEEILAKNLTAREVEALVKRTTGSLLENQTKKPKNVHLEFVERNAMRKLGTKVTVADNKIIIRYEGDKDLNRVLEILGLNNEN
ncbi:site-specific DNA-binding protein [Spiroplasma sabaudiense Ar-1343]|uniref:Site-specific DNA-binding protein n=1 Tax=Spiroplasma sabaudiense Ar-1343 TaxID=1276257 RepID=W6AAP9_9MOLU|nr:ParB/RepB/Spo0J family partition protein [Spiroplasma sabaudiense]AHI54228.1 site-specific DNA-binding protein [Spiroplasma sabaudiense Ar-1343]